MGRWTKIKVALLPSSTLTGFSSPSFSSYTFYPSPSISHNISIYLSASSLWGWEGGGGQWWSQHRGGPWPRQMRGEVATARKNKGAHELRLSLIGSLLVEQVPIACLHARSGHSYYLQAGQWERERESGRGEINGGHSWWGGQRIPFANF